MRAHDTQFGYEGRRRKAALRSRSRTRPTRTGDAGNAGEPEKGPCHGCAGPVNAPSAPRGQR